jgi:hypothetical protein
MVPPWQIPLQFSIPQQYGFYGREPSVDKLSHEQHVDRVNRARARRGLAPLGPTTPTHECVDGRWQPIAKPAGGA